MQTIVVTLPNGKAKEVPYGTRVNEFIGEPEFANPEYPIVAALVNNELTSLSFKIEVDSALDVVMLNSDQGARVYRRSLCFLLAIAAEELFPDRTLVIGHSLGRSYYYHFDGITSIPEDDLTEIKKRMLEYCRLDRPILRSVISYAQALEYFQRKKLDASELLLKYRNENKIPVYELGEFTDLSYGPLVPSTGLLKTFDLRSYPPGFLLRYPPRTKPDSLGEFEDDPILFSVYQEYKSWGKILNVHCVGNLNELISAKGIQEFIRVAEALHNKKIAEIADRVHDRRGSVKVVLIAGPSSSGKTTFTKKLAIQLRVTGFNPVTISLDNYFVSRDRTPRDANGEYDFEALEAIDVALLNEHLVRLFQGESVEIPEFDFKSGSRRPEGKELSLPDRGILIMEGIHGLNDRLTPLVQRDRKYSIYVSALTQLNLDDHNRISTTDNRLLRRIVRDYNFRGYSALTTLGRWPSVRRGEDRNIFPYQNNADSAFNSALDYELAVLKSYAEPLLKTVKPYHREYSEAIRLLTFLNNFAPLPATYVPD
ncbi:MAG TPA: nucleoside kinase, partial [Spirochaetia bacterium]|nr:nucleoside kinase [Spirochaetia bacterium]